MDIIEILKFAGDGAVNFVLVVLLAGFLLILTSVLVGFTPVRIEHNYYEGVSEETPDKI